MLDETPAVDGSALGVSTVPPVTSSPREQARQRLLAMQEHHGGGVGTGGGRLRAAVFGINDGLLSNTSMMTGVAAASADRNTVLLAGIAGLVAGAFSMAVGEYISMRVQRETFEAKIAEERTELADDPAHEREELSVIFQAKGLPLEDADRIADHLMTDPDVVLDLMAREELGLNPDDLGSPWGAASSSFIAFAAGAAVPLAPFLLGSGTTALLVALGLAAVVLALVGGFTARLAGRPVTRGALRMLGLGALATGVTYLVGRLVGVAIA